MPQACSQHPAFAGSASQEKAEQHGPITQNRSDERGRGLSRRRAVRLATSPGDGDGRRFLTEDDPLPPEDRLPVASSVMMDSLYRSQFARLHRLFSRRIGGEEAFDLVHEAFARFARKQQASSMTIERPEAYLSTVATNLLRDRARAAARRAAGQSLAIAESDTSLADPHRLLEDREALTRLEHAIARLDARRRRIFLLHRLEQLTYEEIAREVGMSPKGVKKQMAKALFELRRDVGPR